MAVSFTCLIHTTPKFTSHPHILSTLSQSSNNHFSFLSYLCRLKTHSQHAHLWLISATFLCNWILIHCNFSFQHLILILLLLLHSPIALSKLNLLLFKLFKIHLLKHLQFTFYCIDFTFCHACIVLHFHFSDVRFNFKLLLHALFFILTN